VRTRLLVAAVLVGIAAPSLALGSVITQGAWVMGADALWSHGLTGAGQTVCILDLGFGGLDASIAAGELPPRSQMTLQSLDAVSGLDGRDELGDETEHGVRMAEIVHDIAPDAHLVLVNYHTQAEFLQAVSWLVANGCPIVSHSNSFLIPPYDGTGPASQAVNGAAAAGVLWVNSAGNFAQRHWAGQAGVVGVPLSLQLRPGDPLEFTLSWTGGTGVRAGLSIQHQAANGSWVEVAGGSASAPGLVVRTQATDATPWRLAVAQTDGTPADLEVFSRTAGFGDQAVPSGSVPTPGDAAGALTVGAVPWTGTALAGYSSQGPTNDGRLKPDIVAPTYVTSNPAFAGTAGTSAATPHVAAAAALLRQERQRDGFPYDAASLRSALVLGARDLGPPGIDDMFGAGLVRLDTTPPRLRLYLGPGRRPFLRVEVTDDGIVGPVTATVGGVRVGAARGPRPRFRLPVLGPRPKRLVVRAQDMSGNVATASTLLRRGSR
jgi:hypothetical protein